MRRCYICGRESPRRLISEPLLLPICMDRGCGQAAARLTAGHCTARLTQGNLCGAPSSGDIQSDGQRLCRKHWAPGTTTMHSRRLEDANDEGTAG